tara:strand:- start:455 stop:835 length:381 start_codon:yes stop_codon:yes gene_type:complete
MEKGMNKELLIYTLQEMMPTRNRYVEINNKMYKQGIFVRALNILRCNGLSDEIPDWIDIEDKKTRRAFLRLPNFGKKTVEFIVDVIKYGDAQNLIEEINSNISFKLEHIRKLTEDIERLTKIREAA